MEEPLVNLLVVSGASTTAPLTVNAISRVKGPVVVVEYELFIGGLSILSIANLVLGIFERQADLQTVLNVMNAIVTPIFFADFCYRFFTTASKLEEIEKLLA